MKRAISLILALVMCLGLCLSLSACDMGNERQKYIGIWEDEETKEYMYIYPDGTGDLYKGYHYNSFTWEVEDEYLVRHSTSAHGGDVVIKYSLDDDCLLDKQMKIAFRKYSEDTTVDI